MTEEEAKTKWCHLTLTGVGPENACLGSRCMAWRWLQLPESSKPFPRAQVKGAGYCGLAGKP